MKIFSQTKKSSTRDPIQSTNDIELKNGKIDEPQNIINNTIEIDIDIKGKDIKHSTNETPLTRKESKSKLREDDMPKEEIIPALPKTATENKENQIDENIKPLPFDIIGFTGNANDEVVSEAKTFEMVIKGDAEVENNDPPPTPIANNHDLPSTKTEEESKDTMEEL